MSLRYLQLEMSKVLLLNSHLLTSPTLEVFSLCPAITNSQIHANIYLHPIHSSSATLFTPLSDSSCCLWNFTPLSHLPEMLFSPTLYTDNPYWSATLNVNIISSETFPDPSVPLVHSQSLFIQFFGTVSLINNSTFTWMLLYIFFLTYYKPYECSILDCFSLFFNYCITRVQLRT